MWDRRQKSINHVAAGGRETDIAMPSKAMTIETTRRTLEELLLPATAEAIPIHLIASATDPGFGALSEAERSWVEAQGWSWKQGSVLPLPDGSGGIGGVLLGTGGEGKGRHFDAGISNFGDGAALSFPVPVDEQFLADGEIHGERLLMG